MGKEECRKRISFDVCPLAGLVVLEVDLSASSGDAETLMCAKSNTSSGLVAIDQW